MLQPEVLILRELLAADSGFVSGTLLARKLGISRVAVWMQLQKLIKQGFEFEAVPSQGYKLTRAPLELHQALVEAHLCPTKGGPARLICLGSVDSTNSEAERQLAAGVRVPLAILAGEQTQGRGRRGRVWHSPAAGNLYSSFVFRPEVEPARMHDFTLWMGLRICDFVAGFCRIEPTLKWPNDLFIAGRKAGGMLTEARIDADHIRELVFGLGLNVNVQSADLPAELQNSATSLATAVGAPVDLNRFAAALIENVLEAYAQFLAGEYREKFDELWPRYDLLRGQPVVVTQGTRSISGIATGIDTEGSLLVRTETGTLERFRAGEVTLARPAHPAP